jgi:hypothetical protein
LCGARRGDPERICQAQRAGVFMLLVSAERLDRFDAEQWLAAWEREADANGPAVGSPGYWDAAWNWIADNRRARRRDGRGGLREAVSFS